MTVQKKVKALHLQLHESNNTLRGVKTRNVLGLVKFYHNEAKLDEISKAI